MAHVGVCFTSFTSAFEPSCSSKIIPDSKSSRLVDLGFRVWGLGRLGSMHDVSGMTHSGL